MLTRLRHRFEYGLERWIVRGASHRLLLIAAALGLISVFGGAVVLWVGTGFEDFSEAVWWAFLRLSDPGYLGDDVGTVNRTVSTVITVAGYVVFLGALVAVMTQWLNARMERLESGLTPVARNDHVLVLGWTNRTEAIVEDILLSESRVRRFLRRHGARDLHVVVMAREVNAAVAQDLRDAVGEAWDERKVTLRSGDSIRTEHLARVDYRNAAAIVVPAAEFSGSGSVLGDVRTLKTLLSLASRPEEAPEPEEADDLPLVVAEVFDVRKVAPARRAYPGPLEVVASDAVVSRLLAQNVRHPGLSSVYSELLFYGEGSEIYVREEPSLAGRPFEALAPAFPDGVLLGLIRRKDGEPVPLLNPPPGLETAPGDAYVVLAESWEASTPAGEPDPSRPTRGEPRAAGGGRGHRDVLLLGWNHKVPALLREFGTYPDETYDVRILSTVPESRRQRLLDRYELASDRVTVGHMEGNYTEHADLAAVEPASYDTVLMVGSDRVQTEEESDARTIVGSLLLGELLPREGPTSLVLELLDPENVPLMAAGRGEMLISPLVLSHMMAQVALRPPLRLVYEELFTAGGAEIAFREASAYGLEFDGEVTFRDVRRAADAAGDTAVGYRDGRRVRLAPEPEEAVPAGARIVAIVTYR
jgi:hypothetical protein